MFAIIQVNQQYRIMSGGELWAETFTSYSDAYEFAVNNI